MFVNLLRPLFTARASHEQQDGGHGKWVVGSRFNRAERLLEQLPFDFRVEPRARQTRDLAPHMFCV